MGALEILFIIIIIIIIIIMTVSYKKLDCCPCPFIEDSSAHKHHGLLLFSWFFSHYFLIWTKVRGQELC